MGLAIKCKGKSKKSGLCLPSHTGQGCSGSSMWRVAGYHVAGYHVAVSTHVASYMAGCHMRVAAAYAVLCIVGNSMSVTAHAKLCTILGMPSQFGYCI